jgi:hypothetical protein
MRKQYIWALLVVLLASSACDAQDFSLEIKEQQISGGNGVYAFDSQTVLQSMAQGKMNVFTLQSATPESPQPDLPPVRWSQSDFYRIAQALHESIWREPIEGWKLNQILFRVKCVDAPLGPQFVGFKMFKTARIREANSRLERNVYVEPRQNQAGWTGIEYYPERFRWSSLDLAQVKIPAEQALQIAESQGGRETRLAVENKCEIFGSLVAGVRNNDWQISYSGERLALLFEINVDEQTGEYKITHRKPK